MTSYEKYQKWLSSHAVDESLKQELKEMTQEQIHEAFYKDLEFGTGGMRGIMGPGTNNMNTIVVQKATYGFGKYLLEKDALASRIERNGSRFFSNGTGYIGIEAGRR